MMKRSNSGSPPLGAPNQNLCFHSIFAAAAYPCMVFLLCGAVIIFGIQENGITWPVGSPQIGSGYTASNEHDKVEFQHNRTQTQSEPSGQGPLPRGIVCKTTDLEMVPLSGPPKGMKDPTSLKSLLAIPVGIKQKNGVNKIVNKFAPDNFTVMLFHYDGNVDGWKDLKWSDHALHISAKDQTKWWFAKRFLHPDVVSEYNYIFLWDEDLGVKHFDALKYIEIVKKEGLEISQPALDPESSDIHYKLTLRRNKGNVHRTEHQLNDGDNGKCDVPPCAGWVEMMAPVFSRSAWACTWKMIQNDLIHAWGLDMNLGYCAQGDRRKNVGVVDSQYILHKGLTTLGDDKKKALATSAVTDRAAVRERSYIEMDIFKRRWQKAVEEDDSWSDPYRS